MGVSIVNILGSDYGLDIQNGGRARQPDFLGNWQTIRFGFRIHVPVTDASLLTGTPRLRFGFCSGLTNVPGRVADANVDHALFYRTRLSTWSYNSNGNLQVASNTWDRVLNESGTESSATAIRAARAGAISGSAAVIRTAFILTLTKGSPYSLTGTTDGSATTPDIPISKLYTAMESVNPDAVLGSNYGNTTSTVTVDETTHGTLDTVFVTWGQSSPSVYISEMLVARLA